MRDNMTREEQHNQELVNELKQKIKGKMRHSDILLSVATIEMIIKALEQEPVVAENTTTEPVGNSDKLGCIRREDAIKSLMQYVRGEKTIGQCIEDCPSVWQEPTKTGHWIKGFVGTDLERHNAKFTMYICSECGRHVIMYDSVREEKPSDDIAYPYCHCGAKMESEE